MIKSNFDIKGRVKIESFDEEGIINSSEYSNLVVRQGRNNILSILNGKLSYDNSYLVTDIAAGFFPLLIPPINPLYPQYPAVGLLYKGKDDLTALPYLFYVGVEYDSGGNVVGSSSITYDILSLVNKLNVLFNTNTSTTVYDVSGSAIGLSSAGLGLFEASVVLKANGEQTIKITCTDNSPNVTISPYSYGTSSSGLKTLDAMFGPSTVSYQNTASVTCGNFIISSIQLGTGSEPATVNSNAFPPNTYVSSSYPVSTVDIVDPTYPDFVTSCNYIATIPKGEANGEGGTGVTFTEAALKHANGDWFAHVNLGQQYKNNTFGLRLTWTINLLPQ
jgi:hypothetical protein